MSGASPFPATSELVASSSSSLQSRAVCGDATQELVYRLLRREQLVLLGHGYGKALSLLEESVDRIGQLGKRPLRSVRSKV
jgi:hypothetical protein